MARKIYGLTQKDKNDVRDGIVRAKNNPLGGRGSKTERRQQSKIGTEYNGYFKAINISDSINQKIMITDGFADVPEDSTTAGNALINGTQFLDIAVADFIISENSWIYLISTEGASEPNLPTIEIFTSGQDYELGKSKTLISRVEFSSGVITSFSQESYGEIVGFIDSECT